jgi:thiosulfate reductase cytochrome b subunit
VTRPDHHLGDGRVLVYRHPWPVRIAHWVNALCLVLLLGSGLQIFNAHPALYWGAVSDFDNPWLAIGAQRGADGRQIGVVELAGLSVETTGVLGVTGEGAAARERAFPAWATLPGFQDLGAGRRWHFFFAWVFAGTLAFYLLYNVASGRLGRELAPSGSQLRGLGRSLWDHLRLRFDHGARGYNVLQKLTYLTVMLVLLPGMILTGLVMSPTFNAIAPWMTDLFGGRQSARTLHFLFALALVLFFLVHIAMVFAAGPINEMRSIVTGWFKVTPRPEKTP